ncbi:MAG: CHRD domain-containing protein [Bacteroidota bacterium]
MIPRSTRFNMFTLLLTVTLVVAATVGARSQIHFTATLDGAQAGVSTSASGSGSFSLSEDFTELRYVITYQGLSGTLSAGGHFHMGLPGQTGPVVKGIASSGDPASATISGTWSSSDASQPLTQAHVESLLTGRIYVNLHTAANPAGEIRGQVNLATALHFAADLDGNQQPTPVQTEAAGTAVAVLNPERTELEYFVVYRDLSGTLSAGGHFHTGAPALSGPVGRAVASSGAPASDAIKDTWKSTDSSQPLTSALVDSLIAGNMYLNFHTAANPAGEIRGQLILKGGIGFVSWMEGSKVPGGVTSNGKGVGSFVLSQDRTQLTYSITYIDLSGTLSAGGHFHAGVAGTTGPVLKGIASSGDPASATIKGVWTSSDPSQPLTSADAESLLAGKVYVNFHTAANPGGEIRDQVEMTTGIGFTVMMDGNQISPPVATGGEGSGSVVLNAERHDVRYSITYFGLSGPLSAGGHFHQGGQGETGPVVHEIAQSGSPAGATFDDNWSSSDASRPLTESEVEALIAGRIYANFHTSANPAGEIRGQVLYGGDVVTSVEQLEDEVPSAFTLEQNYPNPFNPSTTIRFQLPEAGHAVLRIYNLMGQEVATLLDGVREAGSYVVDFDARGLASGAYFYRLTANGGAVQTRRMILVK